MVYDELVRRLRNCISDTVEDCAGCPYIGGYNGTYCMNGLITEAADAIDELTRENESLAKSVNEASEILRRRWIPVTERLPKQEKRTYWICTDSGHQCECRWTNNVYNIFGIGESDEWAWNIADVPQYHKVMAWMFLPEPYEPPKEESS